MAEYIFVFHKSVSVRRKTRAILIACAAMCALLGNIDAAGAGLDTLQHYDPQSKLQMFRDPSIARYVARFDTPAPGMISEILVTLGGTVGTATVRVYGHEGGIMAPALERELAPAQKLHKTAPGIQRIGMRLPDGVQARNNQFFVAIEGMTPGLYILADKETRVPTCVSAQGDAYFYQYVRMRNGAWRYYPKAFVIDVVMRDLAPASPGFLHDVTTAAGFPDSLASNVIAWRDINNDGFIDALIEGRLFLNNTDGTFKDITPDCGLEGCAPTAFFIDADNDGFADIVSIAAAGDTSALYLNNGFTSFSRAQLPLPPVVNLTCFSIADINGDGYSDVFLGQEAPDSATAAPSYLLLNDRKNGWRDVTERYFGAGALEAAAMRGSMWVDADNDGDLDLFVSGDDALGALWERGDSAHFQRISFETDTTRFDDAFASRSGGGDWADIDGDGRLEALIGCEHADLLKLLHGSQAGAQAESDLAASVPDPFPGGVIAWRERTDRDRRSIMFAADDRLHFPADYEEKQASGAWGDVNNDGLLDFFMATAVPCRYGELYLQTDDGGFEMGAFEYGLWDIAGGMDAVWLDFDNDGRMDLATGHNGAFRLFRNQRPQSGASLAVDLRSASGNAAGVGAQVRVYAGDRILTRSVVSGRGIRMQGPPRVHFGLGDADGVDSVVVEWPNGVRENFGPRATGALETLQEGGAPIGSAALTALKIGVSPNPFRNSAEITYTLPEAAQVRLDIFSLGSERIATLVDERQDAGSYKLRWDGRIAADGIKAAPGVYVIRLQTGSARLGTVSARVILNK